jgi:hypothetical protein
MKKKKTLIIVGFVMAALIGLYFYFRSEAQKKGWHSSKFWAAIYGVTHYTAQEATVIYDEFADQYGWAEEE